MIEQTEDIELLSKIFNHPKCREWISDDLTQYPIVPMIDGFIHLTNESKTGIISIQQMNGITCQVHLAAVPEMVGHGKKMVKDALDWGFKNTQFTKVVGFVPDYNRLIKKIMVELGFKEEGRLKGSWLKNWKKYDQIIYGISKYEYT